MQSPTAGRSLAAVFVIAAVLSSATGADEPARADGPANTDGPYLVGRGVADITGPPVGIKMLGYVRPDQITEGIHLRQYARTFVVAEADGKRRLAIVTTDLQSITHSMVLSVLESLSAKLGDVYRLDNVIIAATHTHAVPGGYWHNGADTPLGAPFNPEHYQALVDGIAQSILDAHKDLQPGRILVAVGDVEQGAPGARAPPISKTRPKNATAMQRISTPGCCCSSSSATDGRSAYSPGMPCIPRR